MKVKIISAAIGIALLSSCKTTNQITYFQDINSYSPELLQEKNIDYEAKICKDDQLSIFVSSVDPNAVAAFNLPLTSYLAAGEKDVVTTPTVQTYLVDSKGDINFPILGRIQVTGMSRSELANYLQTKISAYAKSPLVTVQILNFKISVLGEVNSPGTRQVNNERISILDAIGMAGDLTIYGERKNILLIRDNNGKKEFHRFDLTATDLLESPYFYLQQNDIVYVEPNKARRGNAKYSQSDQFNVSVVSTIIVGISVIVSLAIALLVK